MQDPSELAETVFSEFVEDQNGLLDRKELLDIFNAVFEEHGEAVAQKDINEVLGEMKTEDEKTLTKPEFILLAEGLFEKLMASQMQNIIDENL